MMTMTEQNIYLSKTLKDLENLLVYYKSNMRQTEKTISLIEEAIEVKNKNDSKIPCDTRTST